MPNIARTIGAIAFLIWGILHVWVLFDGLENYHHGPNAQWNALIGGAKVSKDTFQHSSHPATSFAHSQLIFNFTQDVGGYGFLGIVLSYMIYFNKSAWIAYFIGLFVIGICDLSFLFVLVLSGVIEESFPVLLGPAIWFVAIVVTPFGLPAFQLKDLTKID